LHYLDFDKQVLEKEYSPSSCIDDINEFINLYIDLSKAALSRAKQSDSVITNLPYGTSKNQTLDLFFPTTKPRRKMHVYIHGGYWQELSKNESCFAATTFQKNGCHFAALNYTLAPDATLTQIVNEICRAILWLYNNADKYGYDKNEIYLSGSSAGAHLALLMTLIDWEKVDSQFSDINPVAGVCAVSGIYDLAPLLNTYINEPLRLTTDEIITLSPLKLISSKIPNCPVIIAYGDNETSEFKRHSDELYYHYQQRKVNVLKREIIGRNHFDVILDLSDNNSWLAKQVFKQMRL
jgi:arylformamidase